MNPRDHLHRATVLSNRFDDCTWAEFDAALEAERVAYNDRHRLHRRRMLLLVLAFFAILIFGGARARAQGAGGWIEEQPASSPTPQQPPDVSSAGLTWSISRLEDPAPAANEPPAWWERAYQELADAGFEDFVRPGSAGRPDGPLGLWQAQAMLDHLLRMTGKGGLPFNPRGKWYTGPNTWGVGGQGWTGHRPMIYLIHRFYHYQGAAFGQPWGNLTWWLPNRHPNYGTPRPTGTATTFEYWDYELDWKLRFLWWRWFKATGVCHPYCIGAWASHCGSNCVPLSAVGGVKVREVLGANVPTDLALRAMAESFAVFELEHARGWDKVRTR